MAQRRLINRSLGSSLKMLELVRIAPDLAEMCHALFPLLVCYSDDYGRQEGDAATVKFRVYPVSSRSVPEFEKALQAMHKVALISLYEVENRRYLYVHKFRLEQPGIKYIAKSSCPDPPLEVLQRERLTGFSRDGETSGAEVIRNDIETKRKPPSGAARGARRAPPDFVVSPEMRSWAAEHCPKVDVDAETAAFLDHTFRDSKTDWTATWRNWLRREVKMQSQQGGSNANRTRASGGDRRPFGNAPAYSPGKT